jgi:hypothetical protein
VQGVSANYNVVATVNFTCTNEYQQRVASRKRRKRAFRQVFFLVLDTAANISVAGSVAAQTQVYDVRPAGELDVVLMNSHPSRITGYGKMDVELQDAVTKTWRAATLTNVAVCPDSDHDLLGWSAYADALSSRAGDHKLPPLQHFKDTARLPVEREGGGFEYITAGRYNGLFSVRARPPGKRVHAEKKVALATETKSQPRGDCGESKYDPDSDGDSQDGPDPPRSSDSDLALPHSSEMKCDAAQPEGQKEAAAPAVSPGGDTEKTRVAKTLAKAIAKLQHGEVVLARAREVLRTLHAVTGHVLKVGSLQRMIRAGGVRVIGAETAEVRRAIMSMRPEELECLFCAEAATDQTHPSKSKTAKKSGQWTLDASGKYWWTRDGKRYVLVVVAPEGKGVFSAFMRHKSEVPHVLRMNKKKWETLVGESMKVLRMDRAGEQTGEKMQEFARANGIVLSYTSPNSSAGPAEALFTFCKTR